MTVSEFQISGSSKDTIQQIYHRSLDKVEKSNADLQTLINDCDDIKVLSFICLFLELYTEMQLPLWVAFRGVIDFDDLYFLKSLRSFAVNYFMDDSSFKVVWYEKIRGENREQDQRVVSSSRSPDSFLVVLDDEDNGSQDPKELIEALNLMAEKERKKNQRHDEILARYFERRVNRTS